MPNKIVIFDIDGVLADLSHRLHYIESDINDWDSFYASIHLDTVIEEYYYKLIYFYEHDFLIYLFTSRPVEYLIATKKWLYYNNIPYDLLVMRNNDDCTEADVVKEKFLLEYVGIDSVSNVKAVYDDNELVLKMYQSYQLPVHHVLSEGKYLKI